MPAPTIVDAHVHFWDPARLSYPWLDGVDALRRRFLPGDYEPLAGGDVDAVVFVQADCRPDQAAAEVEFVERLAAEEPRIVGIVAFVDLLDEHARTAALDRLAHLPLVVGIRHNIQGHAAGYCLAPAFVRGVQEVGSRGYSFDVCITATQLPEATELVSRCPDVRFVLDHCGKPAIRDDAYAPWAADLARLAAEPRVSCKLSGLLTEARPEQCTVQGIRPYAERALACFGAGRMMYGTDWPVSTLAGGAALWHSITEAVISRWSEDDRRRFYGDNAAAFYGLRTHARS
jgi:L-fuconolactonase